MAARNEPTLADLQAKLERKRAEQGIAAPSAPSSMRLTELEQSRARGYTMVQIREVRKAFDSFVNGTAPCPDIPLELHVAWSAQATPLRWKWANIFEFVRLVKAHPTLRGANATTARDAVRAVLTGPWHTYFPDVPPTSDLEAEFIVMWDEIRYVPGETTLDRAIQSARASPIPPVKGSLGHGFDSFVSIAVRLAELCRADSILLPVERLAKALGCTKQTISFYRKHAKKLGVLSETKESSRAERRATEFRVELERISELSEPESR